MSCSHWTSTDTFSASVNSILPASAVSLVDSVVDFAASLLRAALGYDGTLRRIPRMSTGTSFQSRPMGDLEEVLRGFFSLPGRGLPGESKHKGRERSRSGTKEGVVLVGCGFETSSASGSASAFNPELHVPVLSFCPSSSVCTESKSRLSRGSSLFSTGTLTGCPHTCRQESKPECSTCSFSNLLRRFFRGGCFGRFFVCFFGEALGDLLGDAPLGDLDEALGDLGEMFLGELWGEAGEASLRDFLGDSGPMVCPNSSRGRS